MHRKMWENFCNSKEKLTTAPIIIPDAYSHFSVCIDVSIEGLGGVLAQNDKPEGYESRKLKDATHDLKFVGVVHELKMWMHYLLGKYFELHSDHQSLRYIFTQPILNAKKQKMVGILSRIQFWDWIHKQKGK